MKHRVPRPTYANVMATVAFFMALGGVGYAATELPKDSVGTGQLKSGAVTPAKIRDGALAAAAWDGSTYSVKRTIDDNAPVGNVTGKSVLCDEGDPQIGGGFVGLRPDVGTIESSAPTKVNSNDPSFNQTGWSITYRDAANSIPSGVIVSVRCADFAPAHRR